MIRDFKHKGLERLFNTGRRSGIQPQHAKRLVLQLGALDAAVGPSGMNLPGWKLHPLKGDLADH
jgi:proteic killer suppression protein